VIQQPQPLTSVIGTTVCITNNSNTKKITFFQKNYSFLIVDRKLFENLKEILNSVDLQPKKLQILKNFSKMAQFQVFSENLKNFRLEEFPDERTITLFRTVFNFCIKNTGALRCFIADTRSILNRYRWFSFRIALQIFS
jgi:hypothetical protein